jgi:hypothetical protein
MIKQTYVLTPGIRPGLMPGVKGRASREAKVTALDETLATELAEMKAILAQLVETRRE